MSTPTKTNPTAELQQQVEKLQAENDELRRQRRALVQMLFAANENEPFDPADYKIVTKEEILADLDRIDAAKQAG